MQKNVQVSTDLIGQPARVQITPNTNLPCKIRGLYITLDGNAVLIVELNTTHDLLNVELYAVKMLAPEQV